MIETLYYTIHDWSNDLGEGHTIRLYQIRGNVPALLSEIERNINFGFSPQDELAYHVEDWEGETTYIFEKL